MERRARAADVVRLVVSESMRILGNGVVAVMLSLALRRLLTSLPYTSRALFRSIQAAGKCCLGSTIIQ